MLSEDYLDGLKDFWTKSGRPQKVLLTTSPKMESTRECEAKGFDVKIRYYISCQVEKAYT